MSIGHEFHHLSFKQAAVLDRKSHTRKTCNTNAVYNILFLSGKFQFMKENRTMWRSQVHTTEIKDFVLVARALKVT